MSVIGRFSLISILIITVIKICGLNIYILMHNFFIQVEENKILLLKDVSYSDAGNYTCMVESDLGSDQATSELVVVGKNKRIFDYLMLKEPLDLYILHFA